jgi:hypothetical protein
MRRAMITLTTALLLAMPPRTAACDEPTEVAADSMLDVHVGEAIARADALSDKIREDVVRVLRAHRIELDRQTSVRLSIGVGGEAYAYRVAMTVMRDGALVGAAEEPWVCECTHEELLTRISQAVVDLVPRLQGREPPEPAPRSEPAPPPRLVVETAPLPERSLGRMGKAGLGVLASGVALLAPGLALAIVGQRIERGPFGLEHEGGGRDFAPAGGAMLGIGAAAAIAGAVLLGVDRRRARTRPTSFASLIAPRLGGISLATRF